MLRFVGGIQKGAGENSVFGLPKAWYASSMGISKVSRGVSWCAPSVQIY
mgnify:CR=1 FL=1